MIGLAAVQRMNTAFRHLLRANSSLQGAPIDSIVHPDFIEAGAQRRHLVIDLGAPVRQASVKFKTFDGASLYTIINGARIEFDGERFMAAVALNATVV